MRILRPASEDEVAAAFLRAEADDTGRYRASILERLGSNREPADSVGRPDFGDSRQNAYRRRRLGELRGFGRGDGMFIGFPRRAEWHRTVQSREELLEVRYIDDCGCDDYWVTLSGGSRLPVTPPPASERGSARQSHSPSAGRRPVRRLPIEASMRVLDVGCGPGRLTLPVARVVEESGEVLAVDLQSGMLAIVERRAAREGLHNVRTLQAAAGDGAIPTGQFDVVLLATVLGEWRHR